MKAVAALALLWLGSGACRLMGEPLETWHGLELPLLRVGRASTVLTTQFRTRFRFSDMYQSRFGATTRVLVSDTFTIVSGFLYTVQERSLRDGWDDQHRVWGGIERPFRAGAGAVTLRSMYERWFGGVRGADNRTRWLAQYRRPIGHGVVAISGAETFTDTRGYMAERLNGAISIPVGRSWAAEFGYIWDGRLDRVGGRRQVISTTIRPRRREP